MFCIAVASVSYAQSEGSSSFTNNQILPPIDTSTIDLGQIPFFEFIRNRHCLGITYTINGDIVFPQNYSLKVRGMPVGISCAIDSTGNSFQVCFEKSKWVCDCIVPTGTISGTFEAISKKEDLSTVRNWTFEIVKKGSFLKRCKNCLIILIVIILFSIYAYGIYTKPRFNRTAKFEIFELDKTSIYAPPNQKPRKRLPTNFFSRFLVPFTPETRIVDGMKIIASPGKSTILIAKESLSEKMSKNGEPVNPKSKKDLKVFRNNTIEIEKNPTITEVYTYNVK